VVAESDADANLDRALIRLLTERGDDKTVCPSEVARAVDGEQWRDLMEPARATARRAVARGDAEITQHGEAGYIFDDAASGPIVPEPAAAVARFPSDGAKRYSVIVEGAEHKDLAQAWSAVCDPDGEATPEFKRVYPFITTVSGNRFHFRGGEPEDIRQNIDRLLRSTLHTDALRNFRTRVDSLAPTST